MWQVLTAAAGAPGGTRMPTAASGRAPTATPNPASSTAALDPGEGGKYCFGQGMHTLPQL